MESELKQKSKADLGPIIKQVDEIISGFTWNDSIEILKEVISYKKRRLDSIISQKEEELLAIKEQRSYFINSCETIYYETRDQEAKMDSIY